MTEKPETVEVDTFEQEAMTRDEISQEIHAYEKLHGFSSLQLLEMEATGKLPDTYEIQDWLTLVKIYNG
jgi:hypothetical protein